MIKTVIFDIGNVLTAFSWQQHYASFGYPAEIVERLGKATVLSPQWNEYDLGNLSEEEILQLFIRNDPALEKELTESLADAGGILKRCDYAIPWIEELRAKGYQTLFLSNFSEKALKDCAHAMDFVPHLDGGIFSCKVHLTKPDPAIYRLLLSQYNLTAEECVFIDDTLPNITAAESLGIHGVHFKELAQAKAALAELGVI
ncbi:MAG: HAD family phosphatase [Lachnospiraceae bacterium]|nr:HAD family phosphatase [Lachnospiraceae bacterium]